MYSDRYIATISDLTKQILNPHSDIIRRLRTLRNCLTLEDPMPVHDIETLERAITALGGQV